MPPRQFEPLGVTRVVPPPDAWAKVAPGRCPHFPAVVAEQLEQSMLEYRHAAALAAAGESCLPLLLVGEPGCGKTSAAGWIARRLDRPLFELTAQLRASYLGESEARLKKAMAELAQPAPAAWLIDEFDSLGEVRSTKAGGPDSEIRQVTAALLKILERLPLGQVLICATNLIEAIDPAIRRRMRMVRWPTWRELSPADRRAFCRSHGLDDSKWGSYAEAIEAARAHRVRGIIAKSTDE